MDSEVLFDARPSNEHKIKDEAENIHKSRKTRQELYDQAVQKVRWRLNHENKVQIRNQISSNARLVRWSDGTYGMYVGNDYYDLQGNSVGNMMVYTMDKDLMIATGPLSYSANCKAKKATQAEN